MKLFILLLICFVSFINADDYKNNYEYYPNADYMLRGIDLKYGSPIIPSMREQIYEPFTWFNNNKIIIQNVTYIIPDQLDVINYPSGEEDLLTEVYLSEYDVQTSLAQSHSSGFGLKLLPGMYSESEESYYYREQYESYNRYTAQTSFVITVSKATVNQELQPKEKYLNWLNDLPEEFTSETCSNYDLFFDEYGTGFFNGTIFGGTYGARTDFSVDIINEKSIEEIKQDIKTQFLLMSSSETLDYYKYQELNELDAIYQSQLYLTGGYPYLFNVTNKSPWIESINSNPVPTSINFLDHSVNLYGDSQDRIFALKDATKAYYYSTQLPMTRINTLDKSLLTSYQPYAVVGDIIYFPSSYHMANKAYNVKDNKWFSFSTNYNNGWVPNIFGIAMTSFNDTIYMFGGKYYSTFNAGYCWIYHTTSDSWGRCASLPRGMTSALANRVGNYIYVLGGYGPGYTSIQAYRYDPSTNSMVDMSQSIGIYLSYFSSSVVIDSNIYMLGGWDGGSNHKYNYRYDTTSNTWTRLADLPENINAFGSFRDGNYIYVVGGLYIGQHGVVSTSIYKYDINANTWHIYNNYSPDTAMLMWIVKFRNKFLSMFGFSNDPLLYHSPAMYISAIPGFC